MIHPIDPRKYQATVRITPEADNVFRRYYSRLEDPKPSRTRLLSEIVISYCEGAANG
ncbi:MAG: hypothetical protein HUK19_02285 [Fibrobacter sp.]|nr:hypothetical protein [Fibrobacter sp.]